MICCTPPPPGAGVGAATTPGAGAVLTRLCWTFRAGGGAGRLEARLTRLCFTVRFVVFAVFVVFVVFAVFVEFVEFVVTALEGFVVIGSSTGGPGLRGGGGVAAVT